MITLSRFLDNPFDDRDISVPELTAFSTDHLHRMIANNDGGTLTTRITATSDALLAVEDGVADDQTKLGLRKARVQLKDDFRKTLPEAMAKVSAAITVKYGVKSAVETECFPQGRGAFAQMRDDQVTPNLKTLLDGLTAHQTDLGAPLVTEVTNLRNAWISVHKASAEAKGAKTSTQESRAAARETLQLELYLNLLALAAQFPRQPEKLALFMRQALLENPADTIPPTPTPPTP